MKIKSSSELVENALKEVKTITPNEAYKLSNNGEILNPINTIYLK